MMKRHVKTGISTSRQFQSQSNSPSFDINEIFIEACENNDFNMVRKIIDNIKDFNIDVTNNMGKSALRLAIENEHLEVVQLLLDKTDSQKISEALLLAIFLGHSIIADTILKHPKYKILNEKKFVNGDIDSFWQTPSSDDAQFSPDITPIMLASQYNRTEIVQKLLLNGERISKPHDFNCKCTECLNKFKFDSLRHAQSRLNAYKGLASETYISLVSIDPILASFDLGHELENLSEREKYFKNEYLQLRNSLSNYSVKLMNNVRGRDELDIVLNKTGKEIEEKSEKLARLDLAIRFQEKPFVAHPNCQQKLIEIWFSGVRKVTKMNPMMIFLLICLHILFLPISSFVYIFAPYSRIGSFMKLPCVKFISHFTSYCLFIILLIASILNIPENLGTTDTFSEWANMLASTKKYFSNYTSYINRQDLYIQAPFYDFKFRETVPSNLDIAICIWVLGYTVHEIKKAIYLGLFNYLYSYSNLISFTMCIFYITSYGIKFYVMALVANQLDLISTDAFWSKVSDLDANNLSAQKEVWTIFYWLNSDRFYWISFDPINLSESLFSVSNVITISYLCHYLPISQKLGPLQITLVKMLKDILKFICIFLIIFTGFVFSLNNLYYYYNSNFRSNVQITIPYNENSQISPIYTNAELAFGTIGATLKTLFFAVYLIGDSHAAKIDIYENFHLTVFVGNLIYSVFLIAMITILLSVLIAMMSKSYENIKQHSDTEWKFARSKLYMEYIKEGYTLPVPFNLLPTPISTYFSIKSYYLNCTEKKRASIISKREELSNVYVIRPQQFSQKIARSKAENNKEINPQKYPPIAIIINDNQSGTHENNLNNDQEHQINENQKLTYRIVMERVVKRYLMYHQGNSEEATQNETDDLRQELQVLKYKMLNDLKLSRDESDFSMGSIISSIQLISQEIENMISMKKNGIQSKTSIQQLLERFNDYINKNENLTFENFLTSSKTSNEAFLSAKLLRNSDESSVNSKQVVYNCTNSNSNITISDLQFGNTSVTNKPKKLNHRDMNYFIDKMYSSKLSKIKEEKF